MARFALTRSALAVGQTVTIKYAKRSNHEYRVLALHEDGERVTVENRATGMRGTAYRGELRQVAHRIYRHVNSESFGEKSNDGDRRRADNFRDALRARHGVA